MSRLDYITIAIVGACILAIIFLIYKMTDLFNDEPPQEKIETPADQVETEKDTLYDYELDDQGGETAVSGESANDDTEEPAASEAESKTEDTSSEEETNRTNNDREPQKVSSQSAGKFMVIAGTFSRMDLAKDQVSRLKRMGFENASMEIFDRGKYAVVLADRFDNMASAERLVKDLKTEGINSYVKIKEGM